MIQIFWNCKYIFQISKAGNSVSKAVLIRHSRNRQRQPAVLDQIVRGQAINFELYRICKLD